jgi:hypothetical protein
VCGDFTTHRSPALNETEQSNAPIGAFGRPLRGKTVTIKCRHHVGPGRKLCGAERIIKVQDALQVKRCAEHQKEHARQRRRERAQAKRNANRKAVDG